MLNSSHRLNVHYGGAEANVASILANLGHCVHFATKLPDSPLGDAAVRTLHANDVDTSQVLRGGSRIGVYYLESGDSLRYSKIIYDRLNSAIAEMDIGEWDFDKLFDGVTLFHITGITFALSEKWRQYGQKLIQEAFNRNIQISLDINFRPSMWTIGQAKSAISHVLPKISYCCANYLDARNFFDIDPSIARPGNMEICYQKINQRFPNIKALYATNRHVISTSDNSLQGIFWKDGQFIASKSYQLIPIVDRIGGGDAFAAGILHGILQNMNLEKTVDFAIAIALLKHTVKGDWIPISERYVLDWLKTPNGDVKR
ncbi:sugar kinase [Sporolactobacillus shoreicorticis]|uniref:Sugar kinase n=1 Tax=Sporolactobacillus shoreicorticis TaxID=1923877 RepID=A0ABW5S3R8_9BACL|nr:sugar kinase [Sporolactobacillus shoreicorticis]MCO7124673.1 sugar kinase [Sporolactobacillus shoreicorticis]